MSTAIALGADDHYDVRTPERQPPGGELEAAAEVVYVLAVSKKERNVLRIAGEVVTT